MMMFSPQPQTGRGKSGTTTPVGDAVSVCLTRSTSPAHFTLPSLVLTLTHPIAEEMSLRF